MSCSVDRGCLFLAGACLAYFVASWGWCMKLGTDLAPIEPLLRGRDFRLNVEFMPVCLGSRQKWASAPTPTSIGHLVQSREVGIEFSPLWPSSAGAPLLCRHSSVDRAFHRQFEIATA
jgi:hypothetical protein